MITLKWTALLRVSCPLLERTSKRTSTLSIWRDISQFFFPELQVHESLKSKSYLGLWQSCITRSSNNLLFFFGVKGDLKACSSFSSCFNEGEKGQLSQRLGKPWLCLLSERNVTGTVTAYWHLLLSKLFPAKFHFCHNCLPVILGHHMHRAAQCAVFTTGIFYIHLSSTSYFGTKQLHVIKGIVCSSTKGHQLRCTLRLVADWV